MFALPLRILRVPVSLSSLSLPNCGLLAVSCRLAFPPSPLFATLTSCVKPKSFVCHSYKKHLGWVPPFRTRLPLPAAFPKSSYQYHSIALTPPLFLCVYALFCLTRNSIPRVFWRFHTLSEKHRGVGYAPFRPRHSSLVTPH